MIWGKYGTLDAINHAWRSGWLPASPAKMLRCGRSNRGKGYRLPVLSKNGRFVAVADVTVMSPRAPTVYRWPPKKDWAVRVTLFVVESV